MKTYEQDRTGKRKEKLLGKDEREKRKREENELKKKKINK